MAPGAKLVQSVLGNLAAYERELRGHARSLSGADPIEPRLIEPALSAWAAYSFRGELTHHLHPEPGTVWFLPPGARVLPDRCLMFVTPEGTPHTCSGTALRVALWDAFLLSAQNGEALAMARRRGLLLKYMRLESSPAPAVPMSEAEVFSLLAGESAPLGDDIVLVFTLPPPLRPDDDPRVHYATHRGFAVRFRTLTYARELSRLMSLQAECCCCLATFSECNGIYDCQHTVCRECATKLMLGGMPCPECRRPLQFTRRQLPAGVVRDVWGYASA